MMTVIYTVIIFGVIIFIHELGHFTVAKLCGVKVIEFSLGMGPAILKRQGKETLYALRLFPIGGYAAMEGENDSVESANAEPKPERTEEEIKNSRAFADKSVIKRVAITIAGPVMNLILGLVIIACTLIGSKTFASTTISTFRENAVTNAQLQVGDKIVKVGKSSILTDKDIVYAALRDDDGIMDITVIRGGERITLKDVAFATEVNGEEKSLYFDFTVKPQKATFLSMCTRAFNETVSLAKNSWSSIGDLITGKIAFSELSGPVGVGQVVSQAAKIGFASVISLAAFISISIGMFNLLPFPALDGGRIVIFIIEAVRRKPLNPKIESYINAAGLCLLLGLMLIITCKDILNLF